MDTKSSMKDLIVNISQLYKEHKIWFNSIGLTFIFVMLLQGIIHILMIDSMIFLYISYKTIAAIDNPDEIAGNPEKYVDVLKLWGCYAVYTVIEKSLSIIMFFTPLSIGYYTSKLAFYFWILKHSNNVNLFYDSVIAPLYCRYKKDVDAGVLSIEKYIRLTLITIITYMNVIKNILIRYVASRIEVLQIDDIDKKLKLIESH